MTDIPEAGDQHVRWFYAPYCSSSSSRMTDFSASTTHRSASESEGKSCFPLCETVPSWEQVPVPLSSVGDPVISEAASAWGDMSPTSGTTDPQALDQWEGAQHSTPNDGHKLTSEVTGDLETLTPPSWSLDCDGGRAVPGPGRQTQRQTKDEGDAGGIGNETSCSSCFEESSSSSQAIWWSVADCSLSMTDQEKKRVSFGDCSTHCDPEKRGNAHKRSILKPTASASVAHANSAAAAAAAAAATTTIGSDGGGEGRDGTSQGTSDGAREDGAMEGARDGAIEGRREELSESERDGESTERDLNADKIVNSAALTKKRLRKRSTHTFSHHRQSPVLLILSGHFSTPLRTQGTAVASRAASLDGRRGSELPTAAGSRRGQRPELDLSELCRGSQRQTPPSQRPRCYSSGGIVNESYREEEEDKENGEEADNERNAERLEGGEAGRRRQEAKVRLTRTSTCYLVHLKDTNRIPKHVDHIIRKFNLRLLEPQNASCSNNIVDMETVSVAEAGRATMKQPMAAIVAAKKKDSVDMHQSSSSSTSCLEQETSKTRSLSLRRRLSLRFNKKMGCLDKSKSVPGSSTLAGGAGSSKDETTTTGPESGGVGIRRPTTSGVKDSKDSESWGAAGSSEDQNSGPVASDATYRAQKKVPRWRKLSLHIFGKSREGVTEEAAQRQRPETQQPTKKDGAKIRDESSRDKNDGAWTAQQPAPSAATPERSEGTSASGLMVAKAKRTSSEASKVVSSCAQQKNWSPAISQEPATDKVDTMTRPAETRVWGKAESNRELTMVPRRGSQRPLALTMTTTQTSSSDVIVPLAAKTSLVFHDAVFYFPSKQKDDDDEANDGSKGAARGTLTAASTAKSEGKVPKPSKSSSLRLPLKGVISETSDKHQLRQRRGPAHLERRRSSLLLKRIRAFFGRSSGSAEEPETEDKRMTEELRLLTKQDLKIEDQRRTSFSQLLMHPTPSPLPPYIDQLNESFPLLQAESSDAHADSPPPYPPPPPPLPPPLPRKHSSSSTVFFARRQSFFENQLSVSVNRRSLDPSALSTKRSGKEDEKSGRQRGEQSID